VGSLFSPKVPPAPAPPPETKYNYRDELTGVETVRQENPDGTVTMVTKPLPLSAEEQAAKETYERIVKEAGARIEDLTTNYDISKIEGLSDTINAFRTGQQRTLDSAYKARTDQEEKMLARYGVDDSTSASQTRSQRGRDYTDSQQQIGEQGRLLENDIRQQELGNTQNLFSLATGQRQQNFANQLGALQLGQGAVNAASNLSQQRNLAIYNGSLNQQGLQYQANQAGLNNLGTAIAIGAAPFTGGTSLAGLGLSGGFDPKTGITWASGRK
jgi:hypothetical protein